MSSNKNQKRPVLLQREEATALLIDAHKENIKRTYAKVKRQGHFTEHDVSRIGFSINQLVLLEGGDEE